MSDHAINDALNRLAEEARATRRRAANASSEASKRTVNAAAHALEHAVHVLRMAADDGKEG